MRKFFTDVVNHPKLIICCFGIAFIVALLCQPFISVNYDMNDYLPSDSASTVALDTMRSEYDGEIPNARVMIEDTDIPAALEYKDKL